MKAHRNMRSYFSIISQALLVLCCIALLVPRPAEAQDRTRTVDIDENGRAIRDGARHYNSILDGSTC